MNRKTKKGQLIGLSLAVLTLVIAAFVLVLGMQLLDGFQNVTDDYVGSVTSETGAINSTGYTLTKSLSKGYNSQVIVSVKNGTSGATIGAGNYTLTGSRFVNKTAALWPVVNFSYTYRYGQESYSVSNDTIFGIGTFADYWSLIVLAIVIGVVIVLIMMVMSSRKVK